MYPDLSARLADEHLHDLLRTAARERTARCARTAPRTGGPSADGRPLRGSLPAVAGALSGVLPWAPRQRRAT